jgi:hypothetical protein
MRMTYAVVWIATPCCLTKGIYRLHLSCLDYSWILEIAAMCSSEMSGSLPTTRRWNPESILLLWLYSPWGPWPLFQFRNLITVGRTPWTNDQPVARPLPTHRINAHTYRVAFEPTIPALAVHPLPNSLFTNRPATRRCGRLNGTVE